MSSLTAIGTCCSVSDALGLGLISHAARFPIVTRPHTPNNPPIPMSTTPPGIFRNAGCLRHCSLEASINVILPQIKDYEQTESKSHNSSTNVKNEMDFCEEQRVFAP